jgi:hypothetical protein
MTDREMLLLVYGALKATQIELGDVTVLVEEHLFPPTAIESVEAEFDQWKKGELPNEFERPPVFKKPYREKPENL